MNLRSLAKNSRACMLLLLAFPVALRIFLLPQHPIPTPAVADDFSYLLLADTLRHLRLANPVHPMHAFFETFFVLQEPSYSSIFPLGQGMVLTIGWAGVALSIGVFCALCYWMLRAWVPPTWALAGGLLAVILFGPLNQWMNSFWGGALSASAGCLVFGSAPRLQEGRKPLYALLLGAGLGLQSLTRPYEAVFLAISAGVLCWMLGLFHKRLAPALLPITAAFLLILLQNHAVTKSWTTLPYQVSRFEYGVPAAFTVEPNPKPHRALTRDQQLDYDAQCAVHGPDTDSFREFASRWLFRIRYYRFFLLPPLYLALLGFALTWRNRTSQWIAFTILLFSLGTNFYPYFYSHYIAAIASLFILACLLGMERLGSTAARVILFLCGAHFTFWYGLHALENTRFKTSLTQYETWYAINHDDPDGRVAINDKLQESACRQLVFVRYSPRHMFHEWVYNSADPDQSQTVWARDLGTAENEKLRRYYPNRCVWLLEPDAIPPKLSLYK